MERQLIVAGTKTVYKTDFPDSLKEERDFGSVRVIGKSISKDTIFTLQWPWDDPSQSLNLRCNNNKNAWQNFFFLFKIPSYYCADLECA